MLAAQVYSRAHTRARTCEARSCGGMSTRRSRDALVAFCGTRGPAPSDESLWARFAWRFGFGMLHELTEQAKSEMNMPGRGYIEPSERPRILQSLLNEVWFGRHPKKGGRA